MHLKSKFLFGLITWGSVAFSAESSEAPIYLEASTASINQTTHIGKYQNIILHQGTFHLQALSAQTKTNQKNQLVEAIAQGSDNTPAHVWSTEKDPTVHAYANKIIYYPNQHRIELIGQAKIIQGDNSFSAPKIIYDTLNQHVVTESHSQARTVIVYRPSKATHEHFIR